jgi:hypothetical protein
MRQITFAVVLGLAACAAAPAPLKKAPHEAEIPGKNKAPVVLDVQMNNGVAHVTLRFETAARDVNVDVKGVDGMQVTSAPSLVAYGQFSAGQTATFDVAYTPGPGRSNLAVSVIGTFNGVRLGTTTMYGVGTPTEEQKRTPGDVTTDSSGQRIKVLPSGGK